MLKIYGRANSINVRKVLWLCAEIGEPFEREDWGRGFRATSEPEFRKVSTFGVVPVIDDNGFILRESNAIVRYLADTRDRGDLYPANRKARAQCEAWMDWGASDLYVEVRPVFMGLVVKSPDFADPAQIQRGIDAWGRQMRILDDTLAATGPYLMGADFTIADIPTGLIVNRWMSIAFEKPALGHVAAYYDRLKQRPAYRQHGANGTP